MPEETAQKPEDKDRVSYWQVFMDDWWLLFFLSAAIMFILYTVWGLVELGSVSISPLEMQ